VSKFIYLHGFASSPGSKKATEFKKSFDEISVSLTIPDLEGGDFQRLSISGQINIIDDCMDKHPGEQFGLIGSSMGGYLAALVAQKRKDVSAIYLMAPGFNFLKRWRALIQGHLKGSNAIPDLINVFHYRYNKEMALSTDIFKDAEKWDQLALDRKLPTRIVHGIHDDTVDILESRKFIQTRPWCQLEELDSDHQLLSHIEWIVDDCLNFFRSECLISQNSFQ
jgi:pimeloyl-ACP methyl ester carboxylesterase